MGGLDTLRRFLARPLLWAMVYGGLVLYGAYALWNTPVEVLPAFDFPQIRIITQQPGAAATELEADVTRPLEGEILALSDLAEVRSTMGHGLVETDVRFESGTDAQQDLQAVNGAIDRARSRLPSSAHPRAQIMGNAINEIADYVARIPPAVAPMAVERAVRTRIEPALRALPGVQRVEVYGTGEEALWVQPDLQAMRRDGVPVTALKRALQEQVLLRPAGIVAAGHQDVPVEARSLPTHIADLEEIPVAGPAGPIPLRALARIVRAPLPTRQAVSLDGRPGIALAVLKQPDASTIAVDHSVEAALAGMQAQLPTGVQWVKIYDQGHLVHLIGADLGRNLLIGGGLAIAVLLWILGAGRGIWVLALSIPLSLLTAISALHLMGRSLNLMTLGALTVGVGLLADDGIVVLESIYHRWEEGDARWPGIREGLRDVLGPDVSGTLSTVSVFLPLLFFTGLVGLFFVPFALALSLALLASLAISLTLIPLGLGWVRARPPQRPTAAAQALDRLRDWNARLLRWVEGHGRLALGGCLGLLAASGIALVLVPIHFLPLPNEGVLLESFSLSPGTALLDTRAAAARITEKLRADPAVAHTFTRVGSPGQSGYTEPASAGEIQIALEPGVDLHSLDPVAKRLRAASRMPGVQVAIDTPTLERLGESLSGLPQPFVIRLFGNQIPRLRETSEEVARQLRRITALHDVFDSDAVPVTQLQIRPRLAALTAAGLTPAELDAQVEPLLAGEIVARVPHGNLPLDLYLRLASGPAESLAALRQLPIRARGWTPLGQLADLDLVATPNQIRHVDGARALDILATPGEGPGRAIADARLALAHLKLPSGTRIAFGGLYPELERAALGLGVAALAAFVLMSGILALHFDELLIPALILLQIPLAFTGGAVALLGSGVGLDASGLIGFLTLIGIALNHDIVLFHRVRGNEARGMDCEAAVHEAVGVRFRPILLTTLTGVLGMLPTALGFGEGAAPEQGLALVILGGLVWSAVLSTNLIPALYLRRRGRRLAE